MTLQEILNHHKAAFIETYGRKITPDQWAAIHAMEGCRQGPYGELLYRCSDCHNETRLPRSCGHRACHLCQHSSTQTWLQRQEQKQLPVPYFMVTFTLPHELRSLAKAHPRIVYGLLMQCATATLQQFARNKKGFEAELGLCAVLHTHTRRLDYHPHVHVVVPGGGVHRKRREWRHVDKRYLFNGRALSTVFRARFLKALNEAGLGVRITTKKWIVQCQQVGRGQQALRYLARYLYRGVISHRNILSDHEGVITFRYKDSKSKVWQQRQMKAEDFLWLVLQHVLPKGFRRARDYGFLHGNAKALLKVVQWVLRVILPVLEKKEKAKRLCPFCRGLMIWQGMIAPLQPG